MQFSTFIELRHFPLHVNAIDKGHLNAYLKELSVWKPKAIKRKIATLKALFNYLEFEGYIVADPLRKLRTKLKEPSMLTKALTLAESSALLTKAYAAIVNEVELSYAYLEALRNGHSH